MIVLGVDPGTLVTGFGVVELRKGVPTVLQYDVVRNRSNRSMPLRLKSIYSALCDVILEYHPDEFAIESAFYGKNAQSALKIGQARGVSILAAVNHEIPTTEYSPREVKKAVVGNGGASKEQVQAMVKQLLRMRKRPTSHSRGLNWYFINYINMREIKRLISIKRRDIEINYIRNFLLTFS